MKVENGSKDEEEERTRWRRYGEDEMGENMKP